MLRKGILLFLLFHVKKDYTVGFFSDELITTKFASTLHNINLKKREKVLNGLEFFTIMEICLINVTMLIK